MGNRNSSHITFDLNLQKSPWIYRAITSPNAHPIPSLSGLLKMCCSLKRRRHCSTWKNLRCCYSGEHKSFLHLFTHPHTQTLSCFNSFIPSHQTLSPESSQPAAVFAGTFVFMFFKCCCCCCCSLLMLKDYSINLIMCRQSFRRIFFIGFVLPGPCGGGAAASDAVPMTDSLRSCVCNGFPFIHLFVFSIYSKCLFVVDIIFPLARKECVRNGVEFLKQFFMARLLLGLI